MTRRLIIAAIVLFVSAAAIEAQKSDHVTSHDRITITTDPSTGVKCYTNWAHFPPAGESIRKVLMHVTLGCPDSLPCAHWDYLDHITLARAGGVNGRRYDYELGRMLTPYGSIFTKGWSMTWTVDVTDFSSVLRDSAEIVYCHSGYEPVTVGWALSIDFEIVRGPEVVKPLSITPLWNGSFRYGDPADNIEAGLAPVSFTSDTGAGIFRLRIQQTGHGMDEPRGCSEFCSRWRDVLFDGDVRGRDYLWKNCGDNPLYPQGGTWIYDRAAWCPGDLQPAKVHDFPASPGNHSVDIAMEPYTATANIQANESIASYLIQYSAPTARYDVAVETIMIPTSEAAYSRMNPAIGNPVVIIRNLGREVLKKIDFEYGTKGFTTKKYSWNGSLGFNQSDTVTLPGRIDFKEGTNAFRVAATIRGAKDAWTGDNAIESTFMSPVTMPSRMVVQFLTNNKPSENRITVTDADGQILFTMEGKELQPATMYYDTLDLAPGSFNLDLTDEGGDGLEFWYEPESGYGYLRLLTEDGRLLYNFESDCGDGQHLSFTASPSYVPDTLESKYAFTLFPRRTKGTVNLDIHSDRECPMEVIITSDGVPVESHSYSSVGRQRFVYDVSRLPSGRYIIEVISGEKSLFKRRFNKE